VKKVPIYNPLNTDFECKYDLHGDGNPILYQIKSKELEYFDPAVVPHIKKHLLNLIFDVRGNYRKDRQMQMAEFEKLIEVKV